MTDRELHHSVHLAAPQNDQDFRMRPASSEAAPSAKQTEFDTSGRTDPRYADACAVVRKQKRASISTVQRHLQIGYNRAAMLLEAMVGDVIAEMAPTEKLLKERK